MNVRCSAKMSTKRRQQNLRLRVGVVVHHLVKRETRRLLPMTQQQRGLTKNTDVVWKRRSRTTFVREVAAQEAVLG